MRIVTKDLMNVLDHYKNGKSALYKTDVENHFSKYYRLKKTTFNEGSSPTLPIGGGSVTQ